MKTSRTHHEITITLCTVSSSLLLCSTLEVQAQPADDEILPWYREDVPAFTLPTPDIAYGGRFALNREFDNQKLTISEATPSAWDRIYGQPSRQAETDYLSADFAHSWGSDFKSAPLISLQSAGGATQHMGLIGGQSQFQTNNAGVPTGRALADPRNDNVSLQGQSLGAYWSLVGAEGWHVDLTASGGRVNGFSRSEDGLRQAAEGSAVTLSVEGGFPIGISDNWVVEPQAQLINQRITLDTPYSGSANASSSDLSSWSGRVGARLKGSYDINGLGVEPYVRTNLWHTVYSADTLTLDQVDKISSSRKSSTVELGLGLVARMSSTVSLYVSADYSSDVDDNDLNGLIGSLGVRMRW